jgi:hypothetical protein
MTKMRGEEYAKMFGKEAALVVNVFHERRARLQPLEHVRRFDQMVVHATRTISPGIHSSAPS